MQNESKKAVIYCRVSSAEQVRNGHGLQSQEQRCREYANYRGLDVIEVFHEEGVSGGLIDRPAISRMLSMLRVYKNQKFIVIIDDISRLARDLKAHIELRVAIQEAGGILQSPSMEFGEDSDSRLVENMLASVSQHHRQKNTEQVKNRMRARMTGGYWIMKAPVGYKPGKLPGHGKIMVRDEPLATVLQKGLEGFANDRFHTLMDLKAFFDCHPDFPKNKNGEVYIQNVLKIVNRVIYTGWYEFPDWGIPLMQGKHEPIISYETYKKIQDKLHGRAKAPPRKDLNNDFALRGFVLCDGCGEALRSCWSTGRHNRYPYYLCHTKECEHYGKSMKRDVVENSFEQLLKEITPSPEIAALFEQVVLEARDIHFGSYDDILANLKAERKQTQQKVDQFLDRIAALDISPTLLTAYERQIKQLEEQRIMLDEKIKNCGRVDESFDQINRTALDFVANPHKYWASGDLSAKRMVLRATFQRPLAYHRNEGYRTAALSQPFLLLRDFTSPQLRMVGDEGLEPPTQAL